MAMSWSNLDHVQMEIRILKQETADKPFTLWVMMVVKEIQQDQKTALYYLQNIIAASALLSATIKCFAGASNPLHNILRSLELRDVITYCTHVCDPFQENLPKCDD